MAESKNDVERIENLLQKMKIGIRDYVEVKTSKIEDEQWAFADQISEEITSVANSVAVLEKEATVALYSSDLIINREEKLEEMACMGVKYLRWLSTLENNQSEIKLLEQKLDLQRLELTQLMSALRGFVNLLSLVTAKNPRGKVVATEKSFEKEDLPTSNSLHSSHNTLCSVDCFSMSTFSSDKDDSSSSSAFLDAFATAREHSLSSIGMAAEFDDLGTDIELVETN